MPILVNMRKPYFNCFFISVIGNTLTNFGNAVKDGVMFDVTTENLGLFEDCTVNSLCSFSSLHTSTTARYISYKIISI